MKVDHAEQHVKSAHGLGQTQAFQIRTTAHAFKLLSSGLYSDKVAAVLREIGCNAADAHIAEGVPNLPFEVKLPNRVDTQFYIKDWGPGLSHEEVMSMYTSYFASTKQDSNDFTGAFGLGSKSPFSYVDSFTVTSAHGGRKRTYSAHLNNAGVPTIALLADEEADKGWANGLMVSFPVKPSDFYQFQERSNQIYRWFKTTPNVIGGSKPTREEFTLDTPHFIRVRDYNGVGVLMGNVFYPLDNSNIPDLSKIARHVWTFGHIVLKVNIGDVNVAASRESLQYDKPTVAFLKKRLHDVGMFIAEDIAREVRKSYSAGWADRCKVKEIETGWRTDRWLNWHDFFTAADLKDANVLAEQVTQKHTPLPGDSGTDTLFRILLPGNNGTARHRVVNAGKIKISEYRTEAAVLKYEPATKVYHGKAPFALERVRQEIVQGRIKQAVLVVERPGGGTAKDVKAEVDRLLKLFPGLPDETVDKLPVPLKKAGGKKASSKVVATAPLPPLPVYYYDGLKLNDKKPMDTVPAQNHSFMCRTPAWQWGDYHDAAVRLYKTTTAEDVTMSRRTWEAMWKHFQELQEELGIDDAKGYFMLTAGEIKSVDVVKRGWKLTHTVIKEYMDNQATKDAVIKAAARWRPTIDLMRAPGTWVGRLSWICYKQPTEWALIKPVLDDSPLKLGDAVANMVAVSKAAGRRAGQNQPAALVLYNGLAQLMGGTSALTMPPTAGRGFTDAEQLEQQVVSAHPVLTRFDNVDLGNMVDEPTSNAKLVEFAKLLFN